jgi:hypothetical protein
MYLKLLEELRAGVRRTWWKRIGPSSRSVMISGLVSCNTVGARGRAPRFLGDQDTRDSEHEE